MGIGNSTSAARSDLRAAGADPAAACGRGTGLDDAGLARKVEVVRPSATVCAIRLAATGSDPDPA